MKKILDIIILVIIIIGGNSLSSYAQVTIGSNIEANQGSLLDLKETPNTSGEANAARGLALPRVKLTNKNNLFPMFETTPGSGVASSDYTGNLKSTEDTKHIGLIVYNLNRCNGFGKGTHIWVGNEWQPLADAGDSIQAPGISIADPNAIKIDNNTFLYRLPSGKDLRAFPSDNKFSLNFNWVNPASGSMRITDVSTPSTSTPGSDGGIKFLNNTNPENWNTSVTVSPVTFDYDIQDMSDIITSDNAFLVNPFRSRETTVTFEVPANECYGADQITVKLNQTNYRLTLKKDNELFNQTSHRFMTGGRFGTGTHYYRLLITRPLPNELWSDGNNLVIQSNGRWKSTILETEYFSEVFTDMNLPERGGKEITDGSNPTIEDYRPTRNSLAENYNTRNEVAASIHFQDTAANARFYPIIVDYVQCSSDLYNEAGMTDVGNATGPWASGIGVLKHTDQSGRFFYSSEFGTAGRWMITNLAATEFDSGTNSDKTLSVYDNSLVDDHAGGQPKYAYPRTEGTDIASNDWSQPADWRQTEGLFYNWYAASGRPAGTDSSTDNDEEGYTDQQNIQGICPNGWHLPSDKEWSQLEEVIYSNISTYSIYDQQILNDNASQLVPWSSTDWNTKSGERGVWVLDGYLGHGGAMKEVCGIKGIEWYWLIGTNNFSKNPREGGFNAMLAGRIKTYKDPNDAPEVGAMRQEDRYANGEYWSLSQKASPDAGAVSNTAWARGFNLYGSTVSRTDIAKTQLFSVRCKKD